MCPSPWPLPPNHKPPIEDPSGAALHALAAVQASTLTDALEYVVQGAAGLLSAKQLVRVHVLLAPQAVAQVVAARPVRDGLAGAVGGRLLVVPRLRDCG